MFEIHCIVGDKKLADALKGLSGLTLEPPQIIPVASVNAAVTDRSTKSKRGGSLGLMTAYIRSKKLKQISANEMKKFLMTQGYSPNGYTYALKSLQTIGILKKSKQPHVYDVVKK